MKKRIALLMVLAIGSVCVFSGCNGGTKESITVFNYGMYIDPEILDDFTAETGIEVLYEEASTPEELYAKYSAGAVKYDCLCTSEYVLMKMMAEGSLQEMDFSKMEHIDNISQETWGFCSTFDEGNKYVLPYFWGTVGILYNTEMVDEEIDSWDSLFNGKYAGSIYMQNSMRDAFMIAEKYQGHSCNTTDRAELEAAKDLLIDQKPDVYQYLVDEVRDEMIAENAAVGVVYSGDGVLAELENDKLKYVIPKEGTNLWIDCWAMTKECENPDAVYEFLDYLVCREDVAEKNFEYVYYATSNQATIANLDEEVRNNKTLFPDLDDMSGCEVYQRLDDDTVTLMNDYWKDIKSE